MTHKEVEEYILSMPGAKLDYPFGEGVAVYKVYISSDKPVATQIQGVQGEDEQQTETYEKYVEGVEESSTKQSRISTVRVPGSAREQDSVLSGEWKMFALIKESSDPLQLSLKCDPLLAITLREKYESVLAGYHLNKKHWNTILLTGQVGWEEIKDLIRHSYTLVTEK